VRDVVEAALAHGGMIDTNGRKRHGPNGSTCGLKVLLRSGGVRLLYVNPRSGGGRGSEVREEAERRGIRVLALGDETPADAEIVGVAGGDGSLAGVARIAVERDLPFVCIPAGTRNHFARDAGIDPRDPVAALDAFDGVEERVDVGEAGGRLFLNNVSLGAYALYRHGRLGELLARPPP